MEGRKVVFLMVVAGLLLWQPIRFGLFICYCFYGLIFPTSLLGVTHTNVCSVSDEVQRYKNLISSELLQKSSIRYTSYATSSYG